MEKARKSLKERFMEFQVKMYKKINCKKGGGDGYVGTGIKILIAVVIGALILAAIYALWGDTILPTLKTRIEDMFDYRG